MTAERKHKHTHTPFPQSPGTRHASWREAENLHHALLAGEEDRATSPGEVWSVRATSAQGHEQLLLAVIAAPASEDAVAVIPLSEDSRMATEWDLVIPAEVLGYTVLAQAKLTGTVAPDQLAQRLSSLPERVLNELEELSTAAKQGASIPPAHLPVGPWVLDEADERLQVRAHNAHALAAYLHASYEDPLSEWGSFGGILVRGSRALGVSIETLTDEPWANAIQTDEIDLFKRVPARRLARLITDLQIAWNERVRQALKNAVRATLTPSEVVHGAALGRRRGARSRSKQRARASPEEADRAASEYVASVEKALKDQ
jgi:hypothetical protein